MFTKGKSSCLHFELGLTNVKNSVLGKVNRESETMVVFWVFLVHTQLLCVALLTDLFSSSEDTKIFLFTESTLKYFLTVTDSSKTIHNT